jgi:putative polyketide hydroxylase
VSTRLRAKLFYPRTMEAYRAVGADQDVYAVQRGLPPADHGAVVASLAGPELRRWRLPAAEDFSDVSPCPSAFVKQADVEEVLRVHARAAGADLRLGHRFLDLDQRGTHIVARVLDAEGEPYTVEADYLLAADGNGSTIREALGIGRGGSEVVAHVMEIGFAADLRQILGGRRLALAFTGGPERAAISWSTAQDRGTVSVNYAPAVTEPTAVFEPQRCRDVVSRALGLPAARFTITESRPWQMAGWVADSYRAGRVFLLGDAAHVTPPTGGFGANTGIQDAWNLSAKLVSVLRGDADPRLLDDYEPERRAVGKLTVAQALLRVQGQRAQAPIEDGTLLSEAAVAIGYRYRVAGDADAGLPPADEPGRWRGEPGTRLPHLPLTGPDRTSTLDLVRPGRYLLLVGAQGHSWARAARDLDPRGTVLDLEVLPHQTNSASARPTDAFGIGDAGALLVRPDHVIAWRATHTTPNAAATLADATQRALGRDRASDAEYRSNART